MVGVELVKPRGVLVQRDRFRMGITPPLVGFDRTFDTSFHLQYGEFLLMKLPRAFLSPRRTLGRFCGSLAGGGITGARVHDGKTTRNRSS